MFIPSLVLILFFFVVPRLPWLLNYPVAIFNPDSFGYLTIARDVLSAHLPDFSVRLPVYPLFLSIVLQLTSGLRTAILLQNGFLLLCAFFFLWAVKQTYARLVLLAALVMALQVGQPTLVMHGFTILTETIFSGFIILFSAFLILGVGKNDPAWFIWGSLAAGLAYLTHPRGIFLFAYFPLIVLYIHFNGLPKKPIVYASIPLLVSVALVPGYQAIFKNHINPLPQQYMDHYHTYCLTASYWETDEKYPQKVNDDMIVFKTGRSTQDQQTLDESWDGYRLYDVFTGAYQQVNQWGDPQSLNVYFKDDLALTAPERDELGGQIAYKAIISHPLYTIKFVWASLRLFLSGWVWDPRGDFYDEYPIFLNQNYFIDGSLRYRSLDWAFRDYSHLPSMPALPAIKKKGNDLYGFIPSTSYRLNAWFSGFLAVIFTSKIWFYAFLLVWLISLILTVVTGLRHRGAFLLFSFGGLLFILGLLIPLSLISIANARYSAPTQFFQYLMIFFSPLLVVRQPPDSQ